MVGVGCLVGQRGGDDVLVVLVHGDLPVVALDEATLVFHDPAVRIREVALGLRPGVARWALPVAVVVVLLIEQVTCRGLTLRRVRRRTLTHAGLWMGRRRLSMALCLRRQLRRTRLLRLTLQGRHGRLARLHLVRARHTAARPPDDYAARCSAREAIRTSMDTTRCSSSLARATSASPVSPSRDAMMTCAAASVAERLPIR